MWLLSVKIDFMVGYFTRNTDFWVFFCFFFFATLLDIWLLDMLTSDYSTIFSGFTVYQDN